MPTCLGSNLNAVHRVHIAITGLVLRHRPWKSTFWHGAHFIINWIPRENLNSATWTGWWPLFRTSWVEFCLWQRPATVGYSFLLCPQSYMSRLERTLEKVSGNLSFILTFLPSPVRIHGRALRLPEPRFPNLHAGATQPAELRRFSNNPYNNEAV